MMKRYSRVFSTAVAVSLLAAGTLARAQTASPPSPGTVQKKEPMTTRATGTFDVKVTPQPSDDKGESAPVGRMTIDKQFHGDLEGTSMGGRKGTFALQHTGIMTRGTPSLTITVVPDSGTEQLAGLSGKMAIVIGADGKHSYELDYTLAEAP